MTIRRFLELCVGLAGVLIATFAATGASATGVKLQQCQGSCQCNASTSSGTCSANVVCRAGNCAECSCGTSGCSGSCAAQSGAQADDPDLGLSTTFMTPEFLIDSFQARDLSLEGFKSQFNAMGSGWTITVDPTLIATFSGDYQAVLVRELVNSAASAVGACSMVNEALRTIDFRPSGGCSPCPALVSCGP